MIVQIEETVIESCLMISLASEETVSKYTVQQIDNFRKQNFRIDLASSVEIIGLKSHCCWTAASKQCMCKPLCSQQCYGTWRVS
jgi:hypothetical protein